MEDSIVLLSISDLEEKLTSARQSLVTLNDSIRQFAGRGITESRKDKYTDGSKRNEQNQDRNIQRLEFLKQKRSMYDSKMVQNRITTKGEKNEFWLPRINSRVIRELPSREEIVEAQGGDSESRARNRRMFGSLLGTLQKFCQEESRLRKTEDKKAQIEKKLEIQELEERALLQKKRDLLFSDRKRKQLRIRCLEKKMSRLKDFNAWQSSVTHQQNQIRTKTKPYLFFQPRVHTIQTEKLVIKSKSELDILMEHRLESLKAELRQIECADMDEDCVLNESVVSCDNSIVKEVNMHSVIPCFHQKQK